VLKADKYFDYVSFEIKQTRSTFLVKLHIAKQCAEDEDASNNSMDVRAKQRLCLLACPFTLNLSVAVSPHVISAVRCLHNPKLRSVAAFEINILNYFPV